MNDFKVDKYYELINLFLYIKKEEIVKFCLHEKNYKYGI